MKSKITTDLWLYEHAAMNQYGGKGIVAGVDEAGRGPLAGPVFAAAVIFPTRVEIEGLNDSKKLSPKKREQLYGEIKAKALCYTVYSCGEKTIDKINILQATMATMKKCLESLEIRPDIALIDGNRCPQTEIDCRSIVGGDGLSASIAAASILAKVSRDRYMMKMDEQYPLYQFAKHKGYGTKLHCELLRQYGPCEIHRRSFIGKILKGTQYE